MVQSTYLNHFILFPASVLKVEVGPQPRTTCMKTEPNANIGSLPGAASLEMVATITTILNIDDAMFAGTSSRIGAGVVGVACCTKRWKAIPYRPSCQRTQMCVQYVYRGCMNLVEM